MIINSILEVLEDGRFVVVYDGDKIATLTAQVPDLSHFDSIQDAFLAGIAFSQLRGSAELRERVTTSESEDM